MPKYRSISVSITFKTVERMPDFSVVTERIYSEDGMDFTTPDNTLPEIYAYHHMLARDLGIEAGNYEVYRVEVVDIFGQSTNLYIGFSDSSMFIGKGCK